MTGKPWRTRVPASALASILAVVVSWPNTAFSQQEVFVTTLLEKAVARSEWTDEQIWNRTGCLRFSFYQLIENLDDDGKVKNRDERRLVVFPIHGLRYARLVEINGRSLTAKEQEKEERQEEEFRRDAERNLDRKQESNEEDRLVLAEIVDKYRFRMERREPIGGRTTIVLSFEPRGRDLPKKGHLDALLNRTRGMVWIDEDSHDMGRIEFSVDGPIKLLWGIAGSFSIIEGTLERSRIEGEDLWAPSRFEVRLKGRSGFASLHRTQVMEWRDYETIQQGIANGHGEGRCPLTGDPSTLSRLDPVALGPASATFSSLPPFGTIGRLR